MTEFRSLSAFAKWFMAQPFGALRPPHHGVYLYETAGGIVISAVLCRMPPYQVEFYAGPGPGHFPEHRHPNVDSIEVHLSGEIGFTIRGQSIIPPDRLSEIAPDGASAFCGRRSRVRSIDPHGANVGSSGGSFLSIQRWLNGVTPTSVGLDWDGPSHVRIRHE